MKHVSENAQGSRKFWVRLILLAYRLSSGPAEASTTATAPSCSVWPCPGEKQATILVDPGMGLASIITVPGFMLP